MNKVKRKTLGEIKDLLERSTVFDDLAKSPGTSSATDGTAAIRPYKIYSALLTQAGTAAPTAAILENSVGAIVLARTGVGVYTATLAGAFVANKTTLQVSHTAAGSVTVVRTSADVLTISSFNATPAAADVILANTLLEVRVYK